MCSFMKAISSSVRARSDEPLIALLRLLRTLLLNTTLLLPLLFRVVLQSFGSG
jgi:hypothetical protein